MWMQYTAIGLGIALVLVFLYLASCIRILNEYQRGVIFRLGRATSGGSVAVGRNPEAQGKVMLTMMVGLAMTESIAIYALVISLVILYANPLLKVIVH